MTRQEAETALANHYLIALMTRLAPDTLRALAEYRPKALSMPAHPTATSGTYIVRVDVLQYIGLCEEGLCRIDVDPGDDDESATAGAILYDVELTDFGLAVARVLGMDRDIPPLTYDWTPGADNAQYRIVRRPSGQSAVLRICETELGWECAFRSCAEPGAVEPAWQTVKPRKGLYGAEAVAKTQTTLAATAHLRRMQRERA